jgi:hypothetical protein
MALKTISYKEARNKMKAGDVILFSGKGDFSEIIKWATRSVVSHVGVIKQTKLLIDGNPQLGMFNEIIESTSLNGLSGVTTSRLSDRLNTYDGEIWWLPLRQEIYDKMDKKAYYDFLIHQEHKEYDMPQAVKSALDALDKVPVIGNLTHNTEDFARFFCSELVAAALEEAGAIPNINASEVTPIDLCCFDIFKANYFQLKGDTKEIRGYNSVSPNGWGE